MRGHSITQYGLAEGVVLRHFKGGIYLVLGECWLATTGGQDLEGPYVKYRRVTSPNGEMGGADEYIRHVKEFNQVVDGPNGKVHRFTYLDGLPLRNMFDMMQCADPTLARY